MTATRLALLKADRLEGDLVRSLVWASARNLRLQPSDVSIFSEANSLQERRLYGQRRLVRSCCVRPSLLQGPVGA